MPGAEPCVSRLQLAVDDKGCLVMRGQKPVGVTNVIVWTLWVWCGLLHPVVVFRLPATPGGADAVQMIDAVLRFDMKKLASVMGLTPQAERDDRLS